jgi:hypothetical protein
MNPSHKQPRTRRGQRVCLESLEGRQLLSAGMGSTFAIMPGTIDTAGQVSSVQFKLDPSVITPGARGKIVLGIDIAPDPGSNLKPQIVSVKAANGRVASSLHHSYYSQALIKANKLPSAMSSAVLTVLPVPKPGQAPGVYTVQVKGLGGTTGKYLVGFYLAGDTTGAGAVTSTDLQTIVKSLGAKPSSSNYSFDADVNRDGKISLTDVQYASMNLGAKTTISPVVGVTLDPATDGPLHSRITNFRTVHFTGSVTPNASVTFSEVNKNSPGATTKADASGNYSIMVPLGDGSNTFQVTTTDAFGQTITGTIAPVTYSTNPPQVINTPADLTTTKPAQGTAATTTTSTSTSTSTPTGTG